MSGNLSASTYGSASSGATSADLYAPPSPLASGHLNDPYTIIPVRTPAVQMWVNNVQVPGVKSLSVTSTNNYSADTFEVELALYADPKFGLGWWDGQDSIMVDIRVSEDNKSFKSIIQGVIDHEQIHPATGTISIQGRDLTSRFIETKTANNFANQTSSQVAQTLAAGHGMTADVDATTTLIGTYYAADHDHVTNGQYSKTETEWNLLVYLAREEGYDLWVTGTTLHFKKPVPASQSKWIVRHPLTAMNPQGGVILGSSNAIDLTLERSRTLARDLIVEVRSYHSGNGKGFTKTAKATPTKPTKGVATEKPQTYIFSRPNMTEQDAQNLANKMLEELSRNERVIEWSEPASATLTPRCMVTLINSNSSYDSDYYIDTITRRIDVSNGFTMHVRGKNHSNFTVSTS